MTLCIEILKDNEIVNTIHSTPEDAEIQYPGSWRISEHQNTPVEDPRIWWIDVGPFYDRFGSDALAIAASDHGACKAVSTITSVRKYINLKDPRIAEMINMLVLVQQPAAVSFAPGSGPLTVEKMNTILNTPTTEVERHIKGLV